MGLSYWDYIYNPRSDSWEVVSNQAFSTKEVAEEYLTQNQKTPEDIERLNKYKEFLKTGIDSVKMIDEVLDLKDKQEKEIQQLKEERDANIKQKILFEHAFSEENHKRVLLEQDSKTNAEIVEKLRRLPKETNCPLWLDSWIESTLKEIE